MKNYTDLEQSKKLAEILSLETADAFYAPDARVIIPEPYIVILNGEKNIPAYKGAVPCWSLASLYSILPNNKKESTILSRGGWNIEPVEYLDNWWCEYEDDNHTKDFTVSADNPIDACFEMILKLYELNLL